ncbi:hypothetical protein [Natrarchaeobaculum sulfurireducens]|uniref:MYXO-CTERM domain-containing protein n=1 Tax=Natrarchaeobaculum sulfurireducens TaxID=2044521 RepID=A0A346PEV0_9EURY|nr:hypothetical protein [Natrarchaeobaculum sulfurireducens]AXR78045.1 hypothetical protein AArc1_1717 [Natrarchaeobaculum sulfurireducens]AXR81966.1 hypothetical protein AArcMg_1963 [Natrarchaeobaculum sulfurireducens]
MPETGQQDETLSELLVKEAVERGLETPMRETIIEAVEESQGSTTGRRLPLVGAVFGLGAAIGFLAGQQSSELETPSLEESMEPELIEDVSEGVSESVSESIEETTGTDETDETETGGSRLPRLLLVLGVIVGAVLLRRRLAGEDEDEWEPIEEFEPVTSVDSDDAEADDTETDDSEASEADAQPADETKEE